MPKPGRRGFGVKENVALLVEMGYKAHIKPYGDWLTPRLKRRASGRQDWTRVGKNAEMVTWKATTLPDFAYPPDVALERFYVGSKRKHAALVHFGSKHITPGWDWRMHHRRRQLAGCFFSALVV